MVDNLVLNFFLLLCSLFIYPFIHFLELFVSDEGRNIMALAGEEPSQVTVYIL